MRPSSARHASRSASSLPEIFLQSALPRSCGIRHNGAASRNRGTSPTHRHENALQDIKSRICTNDDFRMDQGMVLGNAMPSGTHDTLFRTETLARLVVKRYSKRDAMRAKSRDFISSDSCGTSVKNRYALESCLHIPALILSFAFEPILVKAACLINLRVACVGQVNNSIRGLCEERIREFSGCGFECFFIRPCFAASSDIATTSACARIDCHCKRERARRCEAPSSQCRCPDF